MLTPEEWEAIVLSIKVASFSAIFTLPLAIFTGWFLARKKFKGKALVESILCLPLVLPPVTVGYLLLVCIGPTSEIGKWFLYHFDLRLAYSFSAAVIASMVVSFPLSVRSVRVAMQLTDQGLEKAARQLGASPLKAFFSITLPLAAPGVLAGLTLAFARSLGEFGATITFAANIEGETRTLPLAIYTAMNIPGREQDAMRLALFSVALSLVAFILSEVLLQKKFSSSALK